MNNKKRILVLCTLALTVAWATATAVEPTAPVVWICPNDPTRGGAKDFWDMLQSDAPWQRAKSHVKVFKIAQNLVTNGPAEQLKQLYAYLKQNHIALAIEIGMLTWNDRCGQHVEGYVPAGGSAYVANRIKSLGGELSYIAMDEPLFYGRWYSGKNACRASIDSLAQDVANNFKAYQNVFPDVRIGDVEPDGPAAQSPHSDDWIKPTQSWIDATQSKTGTRLAFFHEDVNWNISPDDYVPKISSLMRSNHIPFGVIFISSSGAGPDETWMQNAEKNIGTVNHLNMPPLDQVIFQTWYVYPTHNLPESSPVSFAHLINYYFDHLWL